MTVHECNRCGYTTKRKTDLKKHLTKKNHCSVTNDDIPIKELLEQLYLPKINDKKYTCRCGKEYTYQSALSRHRKECQIYQEHQYIMTTMNKLEKEMEVLKKKDNQMITTNSNNSNNNNSNNTIQNTIVVNNFGHEDISHLSPQFIENCLCYMSHGVKSLTKAIHLDKDKPENHTIKVTNLKSPYVKVIQDGKWVFKDKKEAISDLIWKEGQILKSHYDKNEIEMRERWKEQKLEIVKAWLERLDNEDEELWKRLSQDNLLLLVNNKEVILK